MNLHHKTLARTVSEPRKIIILTSEVNIGIRTLHNEDAVGIATSCGTNGIDERLLIEADTV